MNLLTFGLSGCLAACLDGGIDSSKISDAGVGWGVGSTVDPGVGGDGGSGLPNFAMNYSFRLAIGMFNG